MEFTLTAGFDLATLEASLNFHPLARERNGPVYTIWVDPGFPLQAENQLLVRADRVSDGVTITSGRAFSYTPPKASARLISDPGDLIQGPLAGGRVGDYLLENGCARFIVQEGLQRDFNQVGAFGGNLIDAEIVVDGVRQGNDNFWEVQPAVNIETVINATSVRVLNDGEDGNPAVVESCGPDDLLDGINASTEVESAGGAPLPPEVDDRDYDVEGCTAYTLERGVRRLELTTTLASMEAADLPLFPGDYVSGAGELEQWTPLADALPFLVKGGVGELLANWGADALSYFGFDEAEGVSYAIAAPQLPGMLAPSSTFTVTGVSYLMHGQAIPAVLQGAASNFIVPAGGTKSFTRWFAVGEGSGNDAIDAQVDLLGTPAGSLRVCVTVANAGQDPLPGARVAAARDNLGGTSAANVLRGHWVTGADGCSEGRLPAGNYLVAAAKEGFPYQGGGSVPDTTLVNVPDGGVAGLSIALRNLDIEIQAPAWGSLRHHRGLHQLHYDRGQDERRGPRAVRGVARHDTHTGRGGFRRRFRRRFTRSSESDSGNDSSGDQQTDHLLWSERAHRRHLGGGDGRVCADVPGARQRLDLGETDLTSLVDVTTTEAGIRALGFANPLFVDMDGNPGFDPPSARAAMTRPGLRAAAWVLSGLLLGVGSTAWEAGGEPRTLPPAPGGTPLLAASETSSATVVGTVGPAVRLDVRGLAAELVVERVLPEHPAEHQRIGEIRARSSPSSPFPLALSGARASRTATRWRLPPAATLSCGSPIPPPSTRWRPISPWSRRPGRSHEASAHCSPSVSRRSSWRDATLFGLFGARSHPGRNRCEPPRRPGSKAGGAHAGTFLRGSQLMGSQPAQKESVYRRYWTIVEATPGSACFVRSCR